jgi:hypothetical protein
MGGLGHSDLTTRTCVYPSYNIQDDKAKTAVLLNSYTWQQDSQRLASLISTNADPAQKTKEEADPKELLFRELVCLHQNKDMTNEELYSLISSNYIDHFAFDCGKDPTTAGAFAFFRPQQFSSMWNKMIQPPGEIHAWLGLNVGVVPEFAEAMKILEQYKPRNPFVGLPPYMDANISRWQPCISMIHRGEHLSDLKDTKELFTCLKTTVTTTVK